MVIGAGTAGVAAKRCIVIAFVTRLTVTHNAVTARPFAIGFASAKAAVVAFLECAGFAAFAFRTRHTDFAGVSIVACFVAIHNAVTAIWRFGAVGIASAIGSGAADGVVRGVHELWNAVFDLAIVAFFVAIHNAVTAVSGPVAQIAIGRFVVVIPAVTDAAGILRIRAFVTGFGFTGHSRAAID